MGSDLKKAAAFLNPVHAVQVIGAEAAGLFDSFEKPGTPAEPDAELADFQRRQRGIEERRKAAKESRDLEERITRFGRPSTIKTSALGTRGVEQGETALGSLLRSLR
jgi:hypothetical protein